MATLKGSGAFQGVTLIGKASPKRVAKGDDGKINGRYLDIQVDQSLMSPDKVRAGDVGKRAADTNPHLASESKEGKDGTKFVNHSVFYTESQYNAMLDAAGKKTAELENGDTVFGIKADLMKNSKGLLIVNTANPMEPTNNPRFGKNVLDKQAAVTAAAKEHRDASRIAEKAPEVETPAIAEPQADAEASIG